MGSLEPLNSKALKHLHKLLIDAYGYTGPFHYTVFVNEEQKYYIATRDVEQFLGKKLRIERIGVYFGQEAHGELRLSIEGSQLIGPLATKRVLTLTIEQRDEWMLGKDIVLSGEHEQAFYIITYGVDYLGCGKFKNGILLNHIPKERYVGATFTDEDII